MQNKYAKKISNKVKTLDLEKEGLFEGGKKTLKKNICQWFWMNCLDLTVRVKIGIGQNKVGPITILSVKLMHHSVAWI